LKYCLIDRRLLISLSRLLCCLRSILLLFCPYRRE
jgi:hypothetical protein